MEPNELERLIKEAGVGKRTADKLRKANQPQDTAEAAEAASPGRTRGHGAPGEDLAQVTTL